MFTADFSRNSEPERFKFDADIAVEKGAGRDELKFASTA